VRCPRRDFSIGHPCPIEKRRTSCAPPSGSPLDRQSCEATKPQSHKATKQIKISATATATATATAVRRRSSRKSRKERSRGLRHSYPRESAPLRWASFAPWPLLIPWSRLTSLLQGKDSQGPAEQLQSSRRPMPRASGTATGTHRSPQKAHCFRRFRRPLVGQSSICDGNRMRRLNRRGIRRNRVVV